MLGLALVSEIIANTDGRSENFRGGQRRRRFVI